MKLIHRARIESLPILSRKRHDLKKFPPTCHLTIGFFDYLFRWESQMMTVETYVAPSSIHGMGLFAANDIPAGTILWQYDAGFDLVIEKKTIEDMPAWKAEYFRMYCYVLQGKYYYCVDNGRFMNHSSAPNTYETPDTTVAAVDIKAGEEITCDYADMGVTEADCADNISDLMDIIDDVIVIDEQTRRSVSTAEREGFK
jgi:hypothetical protein